MTGDRTLQSAGVRFVSTGATMGVAAAFGGSQTLGTGVTFAYKASTDSYELTAPDKSTVTFIPADRLPEESNVQEWDKRNGAVRDSLVLTTPTINGVAMSYTLIGWWGHFDGSQTVNRIAVLGAPTLTGDMPRTGTATYSAIVGGSGSRASVIYALDPSSATFSADFASNAVTTVLTMAGTPIAGGSTVTSFGTYGGTGTISGVGFSGSFTGTGVNASGFSGAFFGPQALEMAYGWYIHATDFNGGGYSSWCEAVGTSRRP
ncbi:transferrin-binding protein-like solute binding protein [Novosphingobium sp. G106]|uniref:transferrin-binding protein-like solute binding protein n=1 Tax=Novosphingobium sp. G106 TaxID=2849500 RepID=UPI001C2DA45A|nr:transferrin-binding protein-like solute binding protein [Novosphingobium sp. G106]MBV1691746.1 transferrin-binding protein-like solute binding protein [Novosphingobium sp. G106]